MSVFRSRREGEPLGGTGPSGRNEIVVGADGGAQAGLSTRSQVQATKDVTSNSGEHFTTFYCASDFGISHVRNAQANVFHLVRMQILATPLHHLPPKRLI